MLKKGVSVIEKRYRPNQVAFFDHVINPKYSNFVKKLSDLTTLSLNWYEKLQILHYVSGGFYRVHSDFFFNVSNPYTHIAFYLSYFDRR